MATNYEILMSLTRKQMNAFINSLVNKEVSRYIDWGAWLGSEDPQPPYIGEAAFLKENDGETACYLLEEKEENGQRTRTVFIPSDKGTIINKTVEAHFVRKQSEPIYPAPPLPELSEEEVNAVADESDFVLESLLSEAQEEADALDDIINASMDTSLEDLKPQPLQSEPEPETAETTEPAVIESEPEITEPEPQIIEPEPEPEVTEPETEVTAPEPEPEPEPEEPEEDDITFGEISFEEEPAEPEQPQEQEELPLIEEDDQILTPEPEEEDELPDLPSSYSNPGFSDLRLQKQLHELLFDDEEDEIKAEPAADDLDDLDLSLLGQIENEVLAADRAESEATSSMNFDDLISENLDDAQEKAEAPAQQEPEEEDEVVDFFEARDKEAAKNPDYYSRGRIELLKESLFDDEEEPPLNTGDLVFQETTAIEIDPNKNKLPEAADLDEGIAFAEVKIPEEMIETAEKAESTSSLELEEDEDADAFFERVSRLAEGGKEDDETTELDLEEIKRQSSLLAKDEPSEKEDRDKSPEEAERDFRSDTLAQLLIDKKKLSMLYDPNDPEDQELPTIAFSALNSEEEQMF